MVSMVLSWKWMKVAFKEKLENLAENIELQVLQAEERGWEEARVSIEKHFVMSKRNVHYN